MLHWAEVNNAATLFPVLELLCAELVCASLSRAALHYRDSSKRASKSIRWHCPEISKVPCLNVSLQQ